MSDSIQWSDVKTLTVEGKGFDDVEAFYDRLPARAQGSVPDPVWNLSRDSAGWLWASQPGRPTACSCARICRPARASTCSICRFTTACKR